MKQFSAFLVCFIIYCHFSVGQTVGLVYDKSVPQAKYAANRLGKNLLERGFVIQDTKIDFVITLAIDPKSLKAETYSIQLLANKITILGGDARGLIYGSQSLADDLSNGISLQKIKPRTESPYLTFRAIKFNLPWDSYRHSEALSQHTETCKDIYRKLDYLGKSRICQSS